jgi:hypothetical protein
MISPVHHSRSFDDLLQPFPLLGDCCSVDNLVQSSSQLEDRLMDAPPRSSLHFSDLRSQAVAP